MKLRAVVVGLAAALTLAMPAFGASHWVGNSFRNPSDNIECAFFPGTHPAELDCLVYSNNHKVMLTHSGVERAQNDPTPAYHWNKDRTLPVLGYGRAWQSHQFTCLSTYQGMRCWLPDFDHGFFISAWTVKTW